MCTSGGDVPGPFEWPSLRERREHVRGGLDRPPRVRLVVALGDVVSPFGGCGAEDGGPTRSTMGQSVPNVTASTGTRAPRGTTRSARPNSVRRSRQSPRLHGADDREPARRESACPSTGRALRAPVGPAGSEGCLRLRVETNPVVVDVIAAWLTWRSARRGREREPPDNRSTLSNEKSTDLHTYRCNAISGGLERRGSRPRTRRCGRRSNAASAATAAIDGDLRNDRPVRRTAGRAVAPGEGDASRARGRSRWWNGPRPGVDPIRRSTPADDVAASTDRGRSRSGGRGPLPGRQ